MTDKPNKILEERVKKLWGENVKIVEDGERKELEEKYGLNPQKNNGGAVYIKEEIKKGSDGEWQKKVKYVIDDTQKKQLIEINDTEIAPKDSIPTNIEMRSYGKNTIEAEKPADEILRQHSNYVEVKPSLCNEGEIYRENGYACMKITVPNKLGLHARPSMLLAKAAQGYEGKIRLVREDEGLDVDAKSIIGAMMLAAGKGTKLIIKAEADKSPEKVFGEIYQLVQANFHED